MSTKSFTDDSKYTFTYTTSGSNATITSIVNTNVTDKTMLTIPPKIGTLTVVNVTAQIPVAVKKLTLCSGLSSPGVSTGCTFTDVTIIPGTTSSITNYQALKLATVCNLTINSGITSIAAAAFTNFKGILTIPSGLIITAGAFTGCAFTSVIITKGTNTIIANYQAIQIATGCNLTISSGITSISNTAFTAFTGRLTIPSGLTLTATAFTGCAFTSVIITEGITKVIGNYKALKIGICSLTINNEITEIGDDAFGGLGFSGVLTIPNNVTKIGANAFKGCESISGLQIVSTVIESIGASAFEGCTSLSGNLTIPATVKSLGLNAFKGCVNLNGILSIPSGITFGTTTDGVSTISGCKFTSVTITKRTSSTSTPSTTPISIPISSAYNKLKDGLDTTKYNLVIGDGITDIQDSTFINWTGLKEITFTGTSLKTIGVSAFQGCTNLTGDLSIPKSVTKIGVSAFQLCSNLTGTLTIPSGVNLGSPLITSTSGPFAECKFTSVMIKPGTDTKINGTYSYLQFGLDTTTGSTLTIEEGITEIYPSSFEYCKNFKCNLIIPSTVTTIGANAFRGCTNFLGDLYIPDNVKTIGATAFQGFLGALQISSNSSFASSFTVCGFKSIEIRGTTPFLSVIPQVNLAANATLTINEGITEIGPNVFKNCLNFRGTLTIPSTVTAVGTNAFFGCTGFSGLRFADAGSNIRQRLIKNEGLSQLKTIGASAFYNCSGFISDLTIPPGVTTINDNAFKDCTALTGTLTIPSSITLNTNSFFGCKFNSVIITTPVSIVPVSIVKINSLYTNLNSGLLNASLTIPSETTEICDLAFQGCSLFKGTLTIPSGVTMYPNTFQSCNFTSVIITPGTNTTINSTYAYLKSGIAIAGAGLQIQDGITEISASAFQQCAYLTGPLTIPSSVTTIGNYAFQGITFSVDLTIPHSVTTIGTDVFSNFTGILTIPPSVNFGDSPFSYCKFTSVVITRNPKTPTNTPQSINSTYDCLNYGVNNASLTINDGIILCSSAFENGTNFRGTLRLPSDLKTIDTSAFSKCGFTGTLTIPSGVTTISNNAFQGCLFTGDLTIPSGVTTLGDNAFKDCTGFTGNATVPSGVLQMGNVFSGTKLTTIFVYSTTSYNPSVFANGQLKVIYPLSQLIPGTLNGTELTIVLGSTSGTTDYSNLTKIIIQKGTGTTTTATVIGQQYNKLAAKLAPDASLEIQDGITEIETGAFTNCANFTNELRISSTVQKIALSAFSGTAFKKITIQGNIQFPGIMSVYAGSSIPSTYTSITLQK